MRRILNFTLLAAAPFLLLGAQPKETCPYGPFEVVSPRVQQQAAWHQVSMMAELVAPSVAVDSTGSTRRRAIGAPATAPGNFIDTDVVARMSKDGIAPTTTSTDAEFLRRVTLDLTGQVPDAATVQSFVADPAPDKRTKMIDQLLASDTFNDRWTMWFGDLVQNVQAATNSREYYYGRNAYYNWIKQSIHDGKPYDQMAREVLSGTGDSFALGTPDYIVRQLQPNGPAQ